MAIIVIAFIVMINAALLLPGTPEVGVFISIVIIVALIHILVRIGHISILHTTSSSRIVPIPMIVAPLLEIFAPILSYSQICWRLACIGPRGRQVLGQELLPVPLAMGIVCHNGGLGARRMRDYCRPSDIVALR